MVYFSRPASSPIWVEWSAKEGLQEIDQEWITSFFRSFYLAIQNPVKCL
jgi:hypothetical protein